MIDDVNLAAWLEGAADEKRETGDEHSASRLERAAVIVRESKGRQLSARSGALEEAAVLCDRYANAYDDDAGHISVQSRALEQAAEGIRALRDEAPAEEAEE